MLYVIYNIVHLMLSSLSPLQIGNVTDYGKNDEDPIFIHFHVLSVRPIRAFPLFESYSFEGKDNGCYDENYLFHWQVQEHMHKVCGERIHFLSTFVLIIPSLHLLFS